MSLNISTYIFGKLTNGYSQYPDDSTTRQIFGYASNRIKAQSQLYIHRSGALMYYSYIRRLSLGKFFGLCAIFNGVYITDLNKAFSIFEDAVDYCATYGILIKPQEEDPTLYEPNSSKLYLSKNDIARINNHLQLDLSSLEQINSLPPIDYSVSDESFFEFDYSQLDNTIPEFASNKFHTFIYKDENLFTERVKGFIGSISKLRQEKKSLKEENSELKKMYSKLKRRTQNTYWVWGFSILAVIFFAYLWNTVLFPSVVTNKDMGEYNYYGEMKDGKPSGIGVAFFKKNDPDGRAFYVGKFYNGKRADSNGTICYKNGDMIRGDIYDAVVSKGVLLKPSDNSYYDGSFFKDGSVCTGTWYDLVKAYNVYDGKEN